MKTAVITTLALAFSASACSDAAPLGVDELGSLSVVLSDNPSTKVAAGSFPPWASLVHHKVFAQNYFHGSFKGSHRIEISKNGRDWVTLGSAISLDMALQVEGEAIEVVTEVGVPAGTYSYLRLHTTSSVTVAAGSEIGGETLAAETSVVVGAGAPIESRLSTPFVVVAGAPLTLSIDLNAEGWISEENLQSGQIPATDIEAAIAVTPHVAAPASVVSMRERSI